MNPFKTSLVLLMVLVTAVITIGCQDESDDDDSDSSAATAPFSLTMIDAPVDDAEHIFLTVTKIYVHPEDAQDSQGDEEEQAGSSGGADDPGFGSWTDLELDPVTIDILELQNNAGLLLADQELAVGDYNQIRLMLDCEENAPTIVVGGVTYALTVPSGCESGFKLPGHFTVAEGVETALILDFDARKSITLTGSDQYILKPVIRVLQAAEVGNIAGSIEPAGVRAAVFAFETGAYTGTGDDPFADAVNSTLVRDDGSFVLAALPAGLYDIVVQADGYLTAVYAAEVEMAAGEDTTLDPITLTADE